MNWNLIKKWKILKTLIFILQKNYWICDERWNGIANDFQFFLDPNSGNVTERISKSSNFLFSKIIKIQPANKVQIYFLQRDAFNARKTPLFVSFTSRIRIKWTKASLVGMDLCNMAQFSFIFYKNIWRSFLSSPDCP